MRRGFAFFDPDADDGRGRLQRLHEPEPERADNRFNDGKCDAQGRFWGGTMSWDCKAPTGALYRFDADGRCTRMLDAGYPVTNGPTWSLDGRTMYVNDTARGRINAFDTDPEAGTLSNRPAVAALRPRRGLSRRHDDGCPGPPVDRALGRPLRELPRSGETHASCCASSCR